jgi:hypothetical protein
MTCPIRKPEAGAPGRVIFLTTGGLAALHDSGQRFGGSDRASFVHIGAGEQEGRVDQGLGLSFA